MRALVVMTVLLATGAAARLPGLTVGDVWKQHGSLDGQVVRVSGVVNKCAGFSCALRENPSPTARTLSLGSSDTFDRAIQSRLGRPVVVEGTLDARCLHARADRHSGDHDPSKVYICTDRAPELRNPRLVSLQ